MSREGKIQYIKDIIHECAEKSEWANFAFIMVSLVFNQNADDFENQTDEEIDELYNKFKKLKDEK